MFFEFNFEMGKVERSKAVEKLETCFFMLHGKVCFASSAGSAREKLSFDFW